MPYSFVAGLMILTTVLLSACTQTEMAVLDDKSGIYAGRNTAAQTTAVFTPSFESRYVQPTSVDSVSTVELTPTQPAVTKPPIIAAKPIQPTLSWQWPVQGTVTAGFGKQREGIANEGITIAAAQNAAIKAAAPGTVAFVGNDVRDYGNMVILRHGNGDMSSYAHAEHITVAKGMTVKQGDTIGYVGTSGRAKNPQLHFAIRSGDRAVDPVGKLPSQLASR